jgi:hypothetical protein
MHAPTDDKGDNMRDIFMRNERVLDQFPKYNMKKFLAHFNTKVGREDIMK